MRHKIIYCHLILLLIALSFGACTVPPKQAQLKIENKKTIASVQEAVKLYDKGKYNEALEILSQAEKESVLPQDKMRIADILSAGGLGLVDKNLSDAAFSYYSKALEINKALGNKPGLANNYSYLGKIYTDIGKYEEAIGYFNQAILIQRELDNKPGLVSNLNNTANLYSYLGSYDEAVKLLTEALLIAEEIKNPDQTARTLINLGTIYQNQRDYKKSIETLNRAFEMSGKSMDQSLTADALSLIGVVYREQGKNNEALDSYQRALAINQKLNLKSRSALTLSVIGELYKDMGHYDDALKSLQESLDISKGVGDKLITAITLNYMGEVRYKQGNYEEASKLYGSSLKIFEELGFKNGIARSFNNAGYVKARKKDWDGAIGDFDKAIAIYKDLGDREWVRVSLFGKGVSSEEKGDIPTAENSYKEAVDVLESVREDLVGGSEARQFFTDVNVQVYEKLISLLIKTGKKEEALEYIERSKSKTLRDTFLQNGVTSYNDNTRGLLGRYNALSRKEASLSNELLEERIKLLPNLEKIDNLVKTLATTRAEFGNVSSRLMREYPAMYKLLSIKPGRFLDFQNKDIPPSTAFIEYFVTDKETYIFLLKPKYLAVKRISVKKEELNEFVRLFIDLIYKNRSVPTDGWRDDGTAQYRNSIKPLKDVSASLYHYLIEPVEADIKDVDIVAIIPFGSLHYLPFHALGEENQQGKFDFLIQKKKLVYLLSTSANYLDLIAKNGKKEEMGTVAAFGNPDLGEPELVLPYSEEEVLSIKKVFPETAVFVKKEASKDNFKSSWGRHEIIHLAAHGLIQREPSILLAPLGVGSLTLSDITALPPAGETKLVVLSACEAAIDHNESNPTGAELNSIAMAFSMAGTPSVIATLWRVDDRATFELMRNFYQNLKTNHDFNYEALRKAQFDMSKRSDKYGQPFYWAPFVLVGMWN